MMGTTILGARFLTIGDAVSIGGRCLLDARGGITIGDDVVIASDVQIITGKHLVNSPTSTSGSGRSASNTTPGWPAGQWCCRSSPSGWAAWWPPAQW